MLAETLLKSQAHDRQGLNELSGAIQKSWQRMPSSLHKYVNIMGQYDSITDEALYRLVADVRRGISNWRGATAKIIKDRIDMHLTLYRVNKWESASGDM